MCLFLLLQSGEHNSNFTMVYEFMNVYDAYNYS